MLLELSKVTALCFEVFRPILATSSSLPPCKFNMLLTNLAVNLIKSWSTYQKSRLKIKVLGCMWVGAESKRLIKKDRLMGKMGRLRPLPMYVCVSWSESVSCSVESASLWPYGRSLCPLDSPGKDTGVGCHSSLQGIFLMRGSNPRLPHCRQILYSLSHQGSPVFPEEYVKGMDLKCWLNPSKNHHIGQW